MASFLTESQLSRRWEVSKSHVRRIRASRRLPYFQPSPKVFRYRLEDIERYEHEHMVDAFVVGLKRRSA